MHEIRRTWLDRARALIPFGLGSTKPRHFTNMLQIIWKNRDNLPYATKVITRGVCDGCALGVAGLHDWTIKGPHLCMTRLNLLRLNTVSAFDHDLLKDVRALEGMDNTALRELGRLAYPMLREKDAPGFRRITWDEANARIAKKIRATDPKRLAFFVTARGVTNEVYYMAQKAARFLGTANVDNAARICHAPSTVAMKRTLGAAASTCSYKDWYGTDLIVFFGANPANDQPVTTKYLHEAKEHGTKIALVNPYFEPGMQRYWVPSTPVSAVFGTALADYWFPVTQGGDIAFIYGVIKILFAEGWVNREFINAHVEGVEELEAAAQALDWGTLEKEAGLSRASMREFAELIRDAKNAVLIWSMGIAQHSFGSDAVQMVLNLGLLRGYVGRDLNGLMPIRGHSSVQGSAEMGAYANALPGAKPLNAENAAELSALYGFPVPPERGMWTVEMTEAAARGELDVFYALGGNLLRNLPDPDYVRAALANTPMRVHQDIILTDQMLIPAKEEVILLPAQTRYEQTGGGVETSTERRVMFTPEIPRQVGEARAEWRILRDLAAAVYPDRAHQLGCETAQAIREEIARVVPFYDGVQHLRKTGDAFQYGGRHLCPDGNFPTPGGKGRIHTVKPPGEKWPEGCFKVSTRRGKQFNSLIYAHVDPLTGAAREAILINPEDAADRQLAKGDRVLLRSEAGVMEGEIYPSPIARGNLQVHWPEGNVLIREGVVDPNSGVPDYNAFVRIEKIPGSSQ